MYKHLETAAQREQFRYERGEQVELMHPVHEVKEWRAASILISLSSSYLPSQQSLSVTVIDIQEKYIPESKKSLTLMREETMEMVFRTLQNKYTYLIYIMLFISCLNCVCFDIMQRLATTFRLAQFKWVYLSIYIYIYI